MRNHGTESGSKQLVAGRVLAATLVSSGVRVMRRRRGDGVPTGTRVTASGCAGCAGGFGHQGRLRDTADAPQLRRRTESSWQRRARGAVPSRTAIETIAGVQLASTQAGAVAVQPRCRRDRQGRRASSSECPAELLGAGPPGQPPRAARRKPRASNPCDPCARQRLRCR